MLGCYDSYGGLKLGGVLLPKRLIIVFSSMSEEMVNGIIHMR